MVKFMLARVRLAAMSAMNWGIWIFMVVLVVSQFLGIVRSSTKSTTLVMYGRDPALPPLPLAGFNDEPYADRAIVCLAQGRSYVPTQLSTVLANAKLAPVIETNGSSISGFRVVTRVNQMTLKSQGADVYALACEHIDVTLQAIQDSCQAVGYTVTRDTLRIVKGINSTTTQEITRALPILMVPFWDNAISLVFVIPSTDGSACIFHLLGMYLSTANTFGGFRAVPKAVHHGKAVQWLGIADGVWRNGWYETSDGQRWYTNMMTTANGGPYGLQVRRFDTLANKELNCSDVPTPVACQSPVSVTRWGHQISTATTTTRSNQAFITNGMRYGRVLYDAKTEVTTTNAYSLETLVSNTSILIILIRWFVSLGAMLYTWCQGKSAWQTTGLGAISSSRTFILLPVMLLPRLKLTLCAFFTVGCFFEGQQSAFSNAWYIIYPGIVEAMLYYYSLLNIIGKVTFRRVSDVLFGPTLLALCGLHYYRQDIAAWPLLKLNGRLSTLILSDEVDALKLSDFVTTDVALRINGNAKSIFYTKIALLVLNLLPLVFSHNMTERRGRRYNGFPACAIEKIIALRASNLGGLGQSQVYAKRHTAPTAPPRSLLPSSFLQSRTPIRPSKVLASPTPLHIPAPNATVRPADHVLISYEMSRLGYLVFGDEFLISFDDWYVLTSFAPLRGVEKLWNYRLILLQVARDGDGTYRVVGSPQISRLDNPRVRAIPFYQITVCDFQ